MAKIRWTFEAEKWLRDIHDYIAQDNPATAQRIVTDIYKKSELLNNFPEIGYKYRDEKEGEIRIYFTGIIALRTYQQNNGTYRHHWCISWSIRYRKILVLINHIGIVRILLIYSIGVSRLICSSM